MEHLTNDLRIRLEKQKIMKEFFYKYKNELTKSEYKVFNDAKGNSNPSEKQKYAIKAVMYKFNVFYYLSYIS